jgi:hypothetical protein
MQKKFSNIVASQKLSDALNTITAAYAIDLLESSKVFH